MITVRIENKKISISGHAGYEEEGKDIVCASVSSMVITSVNAMVRIDVNAIRYDVKDGQVELTIIKANDIIDVLFDNLVELLEELESQYSEYIKIRRC